MKIVWTILVLQAVCLYVVSGTKGNVALRKPAIQSSTYNSSTGAENGVDGNTDTIIHTAIGQRIAWWMVDLRQQVQDATVVINFRRNVAILRRPGVQLYTSTTPFSTYPGGQWCYNFGENVPAIVTHKCSGTWRYLMTYTPRTVLGDRGPLLDFEEVNVLACHTGTYGPDCNMNCEDRHCADSASTCHHDTGQCVGGCLPGWNGTDCRPACVSGVTYGPNCESSCQQRNCQKTSSICGINTGTCQGGCKPGWKKLDCTEVCVYGVTYGRNCESSCQQRNCQKTSSNCGINTGTCKGGCKPGWRKLDCTEACTSGADCSETCGNCVARACDAETGECTGDCIPGWQGSQCKQECDREKYGPNCSKICTSRHCNTFSTCRPSTGLCVGGCQEGWEGTDCTDTSSRTNQTPIVVGIVTAVVVIILIVVIGVVICRRRKKRAENTTEPGHGYYITATPGLEIQNPGCEVRQSLSAGTYDSIDVVPPGDEGTYTTIDSVEQPEAIGVSSPVTEVTAHDEYLVPRTYEKLTSTSPVQDCDYTGLKSPNAYEHFK